MTKSRINGHGHILPEPSQIPNFMKEKKLFWVDDQRKAMHQGNWSRPVTDPSFFLAEKIAWMERNQLDHAVMLTLSQLYCNGMSLQDTHDVICFQNDFNAEVQAHPSGKFTCGFVVQPRYIDQALQEIERCVNTHKMRLLCLPTHYLDDTDQWRSVADESVFPIYDLANRYKLAIEFHPYDGPEMIRLQDRFWRFHLVWMMAQTADTLHLYTLLGIPQKFPDLRVCFAHGCMLGQANYGRRLQGFNGRPDLFPNAQDPADSLGHPQIYFDTLVHDPYTLQLLKQRAGTAQIVAGLDDPYPLGEMESVPDSYPGKVIDDAVKLGILDDEEKSHIWHDNVLRWLG